MQLLILLIDDDRDELTILNEALNKAGIDNVCTWASGPEKAYALLQQAQPDIIFLDINMPRVNGIVCLEEIKKMDGLRDIPVVLYSTSITNDMRKKAIQLGAFFCMEKTSSVQILADNLSQLLGEIFVSVKVL